MEQINKFNDEQMEAVIDIIGDRLSEELQKDNNLHFVDVYQTAVEIATLLSGSSVFLTMSIEVWRITHAKKAEEIRQKLKENGFYTFQEAVIDEIIASVAKYFGYDYPPRISDE